MTLRTCNNFLKENYESPSVEVIDVMSEGVFCVSEVNSNSPKDWVMGQNGWFEDDEE